MNKQAVWDWIKKVGGLVLTTVAAPYVTARYGPGWGAVVGMAGAGTAHQARRFGDVRKIKALEKGQTP